MVQPANVTFRSMDVVVQPGVSWMGLNEEIQASGLFFPVDPGPTVNFSVKDSGDQGF
jgi:FAD/FMN-containing dehydrogenase